MLNEVIDKGSRATLDEVYMALCGQSITDDLAWWLANLDMRVAELSEKLDAARDAGEGGGDES